MGIAHEQARPDRDQYISILWSNIKPEMEAQFAINKYADTRRPYDIMSIMHYSHKSFSKNGEDTIQV